MAPPRIIPTENQLLIVDDTTISTSAAAALTGASYKTVAKWRRERDWHHSKPVAKQAPPAGSLGTAGRVDNDDGSSTVTSPPFDGGLALVTDAEAYLRERWNLPADKWGARPMLVNEWEANAGGGVKMTLGQVKGTFYPLQAVFDLIPKPANVPYTRAPRIGQRANDAIWQAVVIGDPQAPYQDEALHAATLTMIQMLEPAKLVHIGDLCDYTNISKHKDHAIVKASVDDCTQAGVDILVDLREVAPDAEFVIIPGNHDIRPLSELLMRAERMAGITAGALPGETDRQELISLRNLWRLDDLHITLCDDDRGWEHAEYDIIPGQNGLVAIHGNLTGENVAKRTIAKTGKSVIFGHTHGPEHAFVLNRTTGLEMQGMCVGCQCEVRGGGGKKFPTFAARDGWLQGPVVVTVFPDNEFTMSRARWNGQRLFLNDRSYTA